MLGPKFVSLQHHNLQCYSYSVTFPHHSALPFARSSNCWKAKTLPAEGPVTSSTVGTCFATVALWGCLGWGNIVFTPSPVQLDMDINIARLMVATLQKVPNHNHQSGKLFINFWWNFMFRRPNPYQTASTQISDRGRGWRGSTRKAWIGQKWSTYHQDR